MSENSKDNLITKPIKKAFFAFLVPSIFATLTTSIYVLADTIMIGQFEGDIGLQALNICLPLYSVVMGLGILFGVGGGVLYSVSLGRGETDRAKQCFTAAVMGAIVATAFIMIFSNAFFTPLMRLLGADESSMGLVSSYAKYVTLGAPLFVYAIFMQAFVRNDGSPKLTMLAVLVGGGLNIILDYIFVFPLKMGMNGAALATVISYAVNGAILSVHFFRKGCGLRIKFGFKMRQLLGVVSSGFPTFISEVAAGIVIFVFNRQLLSYIGASGVVVYGVISNISVVAMSLFNGAAQACQPIISANYGAGRHDRIRKVMFMGLITAGILGAAMCLLGEISPLFLLNLFTSAPAAEVSAMAPFAVRVYFTTAIVMSFNIFFSSYFQSVMRPRSAFLLTLLRGLGFSIALVAVLPLLFGGMAIWFVMPISEVLTIILALILFFAHTRQNKAKQEITKNGLTNTHNVL